MDSYIVYSCVGEGESGVLCLLTSIRMYSYRNSYSIVSVWLVLCEVC